MFGVFYSSQKKFLLDKIKISDFNSNIDVEENDIFIF